MKIITYTASDWLDYDRRCEDNDVDLQKRIIEKNWWTVIKITPNL